MSETLPLFIREFERVGMHPVLKKESTDGVLLSCELQVRPGTKLEKSVLQNGLFTLYIRERAVDGKANAAVIESLSSVLKIPKAHVEIINGEKSKKKRVLLFFEFSQKHQLAYYHNIVSKLHT